MSFVPFFNNLFILSINLYIIQLKKRFIMKKSLFFLLFTLSFFNSFSQVGINTTSPNAQLDISSSNQATPSNTDGILIPKIDNFPIVNPTAAQQGMLVYLTTLVGTNAPGFYYWDNVSVTWIALKGASDADWYEVGGTNSPNDINDNMYHLGNVAIGKNTANYPFEVNANDAEIGINYSMTASSSLTTRRGIQNVVSGTSNDLIYGFYNQIRNSGTGIHYGNYALLSGSGSVEKYGSYNRIINGSGNKFGSYNYISGAGGNFYGNYNFIENGTAFFQYGTFNQISNTNDTYKIGVNNGISGAGNASHIGVANSLSGTGIGEQVGVNNQILNNGNGLQYGVKNLFSNTSNGEKRGLTSTFTNTQGDDFGIENTFNSTGTTGNQYGMRNLFFGNKSGLIHGIRNESYSLDSNIIGLSNIFSANSGSKVGVENILNVDDATSTLTGTYTYLNGTGNGTKRGHYVFINDLIGGSTGEKTGFYVDIPITAGGNHYGIYSSVLKPSGYAGFFLGRTAIGTTSANTYILPLTRGTNGQIMQTDGSGNVTWRNPNTALNNFAWTTTGNSGTNPSTNFIGTTDNQDLVFRRNNSLCGKISLENTSFGLGASATSSIGFQNTAIGNSALTLNSSGSFNTAVGYSVLAYNVDGMHNTAIGVEVLLDNTTGNFNTSIGSRSLSNNISGANNVANGYESLNRNTTGSFNTATGTFSLRYNTTGVNNNGFGYSALNNNTTGNNNNALGNEALRNNTIGINNVGIGHNALYANREGNSSASLGFEALFSNVTGNRNTAIGSNSIHNLSTASFSTAIGANAFFNGNYSNSVAIGDASAISADNQIRLGDASVTSIGGFANWTNVSDKRFKKNIQENVPGLAFITKLKPVTYSLDLNAIHSYLKTPSEIRKPETETDKKQEIQTGFIAQDVEKAATELGFSFSGVDKPKNNEDYYGLRYAEFVVPLVKAIQEQQVIIEKQQEKIQSLEERLLKLETMFTKE